MAVQNRNEDADADLKDTPSSVSGEDVTPPHGDPLAHVADDAGEDDEDDRDPGTAIGGA